MIAAPHCGQRIKTNLVSITVYFRSVNSRCLVIDVIDTIAHNMIMKYSSCMVILFLMVDGVRIVV